MLSKLANRKNTDERIWYGKFQNITNALHWHNECELIYVESGSLSVIIEDKSYLVSEGYSIFVKSDSSHRIFSEKDTVLSCIQFSPFLIKEITAKKALVSPLIQENQSIKETMQIIHREFSEKKSFFQLRIEALIQDIFVSVFRTEPTEKINRQKDVALTFSELLDTINTEYQFITFEEAANRMYFSKSYFSKVFKRFSGMNFSTYLNLVRIEKAIEMLDEGKLKITNIATRSGFNSIRNFNRIFYKYTGYSPRTLPSNFELDFKPQKIQNERFDPTFDGYKELT